MGRQSFINSWHPFCDAHFFISLSLSLSLFLSLSLLSAEIMNIIYYQHIITT
jgi:hypothetical protein